MSIKIIEPRAEKVEFNYKLEFPYDGDWAKGGYSFPCDKNGNILTSKVPIEMIESYIFVLKTPQHYPIKKIIKDKSSFRYFPLAICDCGESFDLIDQYMGACKCPKCGQWYNMFGQELKAPEFWGEF